MFFNPTKKFPLLYNAIVRTGLASTPGVPPLDQVGQNVLLPPFTNDMPNMPEDKLKGLLVAHVSLFIHNAMVAKDFPVNGELERILTRSEKKLNRIKDNPWFKLMQEYGEQGACPDLETLSQQASASPLNSTAYALARPEWEKEVPKIPMRFVEWFISNREPVENWHLNRIKEFQ